MVAYGRWSHIEGRFDCIHRSVPCDNNCFNVMKAAVFVLERHKGAILPVNTANFTGDVITVSKQLTLVFGTKNQIM